MAFIIALFGPDGAGKTTLAKMIAVYLQAKGIKVSYVRFKSHHLAMYLLIRLMQKLRLLPSTTSPRILDYAIKHRFNRSKLFISLEIANAIIWLLLNIRLRSMLGTKIIIAERYIPDFIVSMLLVKCDINTFNTLLRLFRKFTANGISIFLYAKPEDIIDRKKDENLSINYIKLLLKLYKHVAKYVNVNLAINTSQHSIPKTFSIAKNHIDKHLKQTHYHRHKQRLLQAS